MDFVKKTVIVGTLVSSVFASSVSLGQVSCDALTLPSPDPTGRSLYVAPGGKDSCSNVSTRAPFATLGGAAACAQPGDTIYVKAGSYGRQLVGGLKGNAQHWILITNNPGDAPVFDGGGAIGDWGAIVTLSNAAYVAFSGFEIRNTGIINTSTTYGGGAGMSVQNADHVIVGNNRIHDSARYGLVWDHGASNVLAYGNTLYNNVLLNKNGAEVSKLGYRDGTASTGNSPSYANSCVSWKKNTLYSSWGECLSVTRTNGGIMQGNTVHDCVGANIYLDSSQNYTVDANYLYDTTDTFNSSDGIRSLAIAVAKEFSGQNTFPNLNVVISNNIIDSTGEGIRWGNWGAGDAYYGNVVVAHNTLINEQTNGIHFDAPPSGGPTGVNLLANNIVFRNVGNGAAINVPLASWKVHNNLFPNGLPAGVDASNTAQNPALVGPALGQTGTYMLQAGSPAIGAGTGEVYASVPLDFSGATRSDTHPSIGIDEHAQGYGGSNPSGVEQTLWTLQTGSAGDDNVNAVAADSSGNVFLAGNTNGTLDYMGQGGLDAFVEKYDVNHNKIWGRQLGNIGDQRAMGIAVDGSGDVFIAGSTTAPLYTNYNGGGHDGFLAKYASDGRRLWLIQLGSAGDDVINAVAVDSAGNTYVTGFTSGSLDYSVQGGLDVFIEKYDPQGQKLWGRQLGSAGDEIGTSIAVDEAHGRVMLGGSTTDALYTGYKGGARDAFLASYDMGTGQRYWIAMIGTAADDVVKGVAVNAAGNTFVTGATAGNLEGPNAGGYDAFVQAYDVNGNKVGGTQWGSAADDSSNGVACDTVGNIWSGGTTQGSMNGAPNHGATDAFLTKLDGSLNLQWSKQLGTSVDDVATSVAVSGASRVYLGASTLGSLSSANSGGWDILLPQYSP